MAKNLVRGTVHEMKTIRKSFDLLGEFLLKYPKLHEFNPSIFLSAGHFELEWKVDGYIIEVGFLPGVIELWSEYCGDECEIHDVDDLITKLNRCCPYGDD